MKSLFLAKRKIRYLLFCFLVIAFSIPSVVGQKKIPKPLSFEEFIKENVAKKKEIDVFLKEPSWAQFDPEVGYILGNYMPNDGVDKSSTISTVQSNGARTSFMYTNKPCRINTYGNSFTQCHQVSDGETWQEYLAAHLGEPIRNFGMGGFGVYQAYRRLLREEKTDHGAEYLVFYIWGDDHIRSLLRCRYMLFRDWKVTQDEREGRGRMFHGNFWPNIEMDLQKGELVERNSLITTADELYKMTNPEWMYETLKDDLALQMYLFEKNWINDIDIPKLKKLAKSLEISVNFDTIQDMRKAVGDLLDRYSFASTKYILNKVKEFSENNNKKLLVVLFDPYQVTTSLIKKGTRYDQEIVDYLEQNQFNYFDMNLVHVKDYKDFNLSLDDYFKRYFIGHYNPAGNHFFAVSIKPTVVEWLNPKPITYQSQEQRIIDFKGYLDGY